MKNAAYSNLVFLSLVSLMVTAGSCGNYSNGNSAQSPGTTPAPTNVSVNIPVGAAGKGAAAYGANPLVVPVGATVTWINQDSMAHTVTSDTGVWNSGPIQPGQSFARQFSNPGGFPYHCTIHGPASMSGILQVGSPQPSPSSSPTLATFARVNQEVLIPNCLSCHSGPRPSAGLDFSTYENIFHNSVMPNLVVPGKPNQSTLYLDIQNGAAPGSPVPLMPAQIQVVFDWIQSGAPNN